MYNNVEIFAVIITSIIIISGAETGRMHGINISLLWSKYHLAKKKNRSLPFLHFNFMVLVYGRNSLSTDCSLSSRTHTPKTNDQTHSYHTAGRTVFHFQLYATIHNDHSDHLFLFVQKHKTKTENLFRRIMISKKLTHTHTQLSKIEANWAVELCISSVLFMAPSRNL